MPAARYVVQVNGIEDHHDEKFFEQLLQNALMHVWIARDSYNHKPMGYCFIEFKSEADMTSGKVIIRNNIKPTHICTI